MNCAVLTQFVFTTRGVTMCKWRHSNNGRRSRHLVGHVL